MNKDIKSISTAKQEESSFTLFFILDTGLSVRSRTVHHAHAHAHAHTSGSVDSGLLISRDVKEEGGDVQTIESLHISNKQRLLHILEKVQEQTETCVNKINMCSNKQKQKKWKRMNIVHVVLCIFPSDSPVSWSR